MTSPSELILERLAEVRDAYLAFRSEAESDLALSRAVAAVFGASERESVAAFLAGHEPDDAEDRVDGAGFREELIAQLEGHRERDLARAAATTVGSDPGDGDVVVCLNGHQTRAGNFCEQCGAPLSGGVSPPSVPAATSSGWWSERSSRQRTWIIVGIVIVGLTIVGSISGDPSPSRTSGTASPSPEVAPTPPRSVAPRSISAVTSTGLTRGRASVACDRRGEEVFPYGFKGHWTLRRIDSRIENDRWFLKAGGTVTNQFGADRRVTVECTVSGSDGSPTVEAFDAY